MRIPRVVLVRVDGGLASQMWQYSLGLAIGRHSPLPVAYDFSWYRQSGKDITNTHNRLLVLDKVFAGVTLRSLPEEMESYFIRRLDFFSGTRLKFEPELLAVSFPAYVGGYYASYRYLECVENVLRKLYTFRPPPDTDNQAALARIHEAEASVALHVRRGDFVGSIHDVTTPRYFHTAVEAMARALRPRKATFFVFSNGMDWTRRMLSTLPHHFVFVDHNDNDHCEHDMHLMSQCEHFIISNSGFSWWPAWLSTRNPQKRVMMPDVWMRDEKPEERLIMQLPGWRPVSVR